MLIRRLSINSGAMILAVMLITVSLPYSPVHAGTMQWTAVNTPGNTNNLVVSPSEVNVIALSPDGMTFFAADIPHQKLYKSTNAGYGWTDISNGLTGAGAALPVWHVRVSPDNPGIVAAVTSSGGLPGAIFISTDGGTNWQNLNFPPGNNIGALAISPLYGVFDIAAGTRSGAGGGKLLIYKMTGTGNWVDQGFSGDVLAAAFSPNYGTDNSLVIVSATNSGTFAHLGLHDVAANTTNFGSWSPVEITTAGAGTSPKVNQVKTADLELPADFLGQINTLRKFFVSTNDAGLTGNAGIYRIDDTIIYKILQATGTNMISSISYFGTSSSGKLLAGEVKANPALANAGIQYCLNAAENCPQATCLIWQKALKPPTGGANSGNANAQIEWSVDGSKAYCGTSSADIAGAGWPNGYSVSQALDESAFSYSADGAVSWNQIGIVDTQINSLSDAVATPASDTLYLASINTNAGNTGFDSVWKRSAGTPLVSWERILCFLASSNQIILRLNTPRPIQLFVGVPSTSMLTGSADGGQTWTSITPGVNITDFKVTTISSISTIFVLSGSIIRKGEYTGSTWKWGPSISTGLPSGHMLYANAAGVVIAGDTQGGVAFSQNAGGQFTVLPVLPVPGNVQVILDDRVIEPYLIHAATDAPGSGIYAWITGASSKWLDMQPPRRAYFGLAQLNTFYGCSSDGSTSAVARTLQPEQLAMAEWDTMQAGLTAGVIFTRPPSSLAVSSGVVLLAIDNRPYTATTGRLWQYGDALAAGSSAGPGISQLPPIEVLLQAPTLSSPPTNTVIESTASGEMPAIEFRWQQSTAPNGYDLWIAKDANFNQVVLQQSIIPENVMTPKWILEAGTTLLEPGQIYYWKVRVNRIAYTYQKIEGDWSAVSIFSIAPGNKSESAAPAAPTLMYPADRATGIPASVSFQWTAVPGATEYEFSLASDEKMLQPVASAKTQATEYRYTATLDSGATYFWQVKVTKPATGRPTAVSIFTVKQTAQAPEVPSPVIPAWVYLVLGAVIVLLIILIIVFWRKRPY